VPLAGWLHSGLIEVGVMSQSVSQTVEPVQAASGEAEIADDFSYRPVPPLAPISLFLGICSLAGFAGIPCLAIGLVGGVIGLIALWQIRRGAGELGGTVVAASGMILSGTLFLAASSYHVYAYVTELPEGYRRVSFNELSKHEPIFSEGKVQVDPEVTELDGKPIYIKGYMYPTRQQTGISEFVMVKDTGQCCFGGQPKLTDMIVVKFEDGMFVNHREQQLVGVGGIFRVRAGVQSGVLTAIYTLEGTHFR
jgi:hypothetical protein